MDPGGQTSLQGQTQRDPETNARFGLAMRGATMAPARAVSSVGRAPARQAGGHWFEPSTAHLGRPWKQGLFAFTGEWQGARFGVEHHNWIFRETVLLAPGYVGLQARGPALPGKRVGAS